MPDLTGLDLKEGDKRWLAIVAGETDAYDGEAVNPRHLSLLERLMGYGRGYVAKAADSSDAGSDGAPAAKPAPTLELVEQPAPAAADA